MVRGQRDTESGARLDCETLEDRATPAAAYALAGSGLIVFDTADPATATPIPVTGVAPGESLAGIDFAPDGALYALGVDAGAEAATLYRVSVQTGQTTAVGAPGGVKFAGPTGPLDLPDPDEVEYSLDFDPAAGTLRVVTSSGLNFRVGPDGAPLDGDSGLAGSIGGVNPDGAINGLPADSTGVRGTAFGPDPSQPGATRQYTLDAGSDALFAQDAAQSGTQTQRVDVTLDGEPLDFTAVAGFDVSQDGAVAALTVDGDTRLYSLDLATGAATELAPAPTGARDVALAPPGGEIAFADAIFTTPEGTTFAALTLTRTGSAASAVSVTVTPTGGTATAGPDFLPGPYTVTFAPGQSVATLTIPLTADDTAEPDETVELALSAPTGGATLGGQATATVTITDGGTPPAPPASPPAPSPAPPGLVLGTALGAGAVNVLNADGTLRSAFLPYGEGMRAGVRVATGDVTGDGVADVITAPALGPAHVKVFDGVSGAEVRSFLAFDPGFQGGLSVAAGDVDGDGVADIITGTAAGSSHVKVFSGASGAELRSFFAYDLFGGGVTVAAGDVNGDGRADIVTGTASYTSHVKVFDGGSLAVLQSTFAFIGQSGVTVAAGDVDGDGKSDVVVGTAAGAAHVKVYSGQSGEEIRSVRAFTGYLGGVNVGARDLNGDGLADFLAATASGASHVKGFDGGTSAEINSFLAFGAGFNGGAYVA